jgi:hypothetical protein
VRDHPGAELRSTVWSNPVSSKSSPSAYAHDKRSRTAPAACRSVRFSAIWNTVTNASRPGDQPSGPVTPNAPVNSTSANNSPNPSRTATGSGTSRPRYLARTALATSAAGSGHGRGSIDMPTTPPRPEADRNRPHHDHPQPHHPNDQLQRMTTRVGRGYDRLVTQGQDLGGSTMVNARTAAGTARTLGPPGLWRCGGPDAAVGFLDGPSGRVGHLARKTATGSR